jgi:hypothetical protein
MANFDRVNKHQSATILRKEDQAGLVDWQLNGSIEIPGIWKAGKLRTNETQQIFLQMEAATKVGNRTNIFSIHRPTMQGLARELQKLFGGNVVYTAPNAGPKDNSSVSTTPDARVSEAKLAVDAEKAEKHSLAESQAVVEAEEQQYINHCNSLTQEQAEKQTHTAFEYWLNHARSPIAGLKMVEFMSWPSGQFFNAEQVERAIRAHSKYRVPKQSDFDAVHALLLSQSCYVMTPTVKRSMAAYQPKPYAPPLQQTISEDDINFALKALPKGIAITPEVAAACGISRQVFEVLKARFAQANAARPQDLKAAAVAGRSVNDRRVYMP